MLHNFYQRPETGLLQTLTTFIPYSLQALGHCCKGSGIKCSRRVSAVIVSNLLHNIFALLYHRTSVIALHIYQGYVNWPRVAGIWISTSKLTMNTAIIMRTILQLKSVRIIYRQNLSEGNAV